MDVAAIRRAAYREGHTNGHATGHALGFAKGISKQSGASLLPPASPPDSPLRPSANGHHQVPSSLAAFAASLAPSSTSNDEDDANSQHQQSMAQRRSILEKQVRQLQSAKEATQQARRALLEQTFAVSLLPAESLVRGAQAAALLGGYQAEIDALATRASLADSAFSELLNELCAAAGVQPLIGATTSSSSSQALLVPSQPSQASHNHPSSWPPLLSDLLTGDGAVGLEELKQDLMSPEPRKSAGPEEGDHRAATHELLAAAMEAIQLTQAALHPTEHGHGHRKDKRHDDDDGDEGDGDDDFDATLNLSEISDPSRQSLHQLLQHQTKERGQRPTSKHPRGSSHRRQKGSAAVDDDGEGEDYILSANSSLHSLCDAGNPLHVQHRAHKKRASKHSRGRGDERGERTISKDDGSPMLQAPLLVVKLWAAKVRAKM